MPHKFSRGLCKVVVRYDVRDAASEIAEIAMAMLGEEESSVLGSELLSILCRSVLPDSGISLFDRLSELVLKCENRDAVSNVIVTLKGFVKKYRIPFAKIQPVVDSLMNGRSSAIPDLDMIEDDLNLFSFLTTIIKKFRRSAEPYWTRLMAILPDISVEVMTEIAGPIEAGLALKVFSEEIVQKFFVILCELINENEDEFEPLVSLLGMVFAIKRNYGGCIDGPPLLTKLGEIWELYREEEEEIEVLSMLILELGADSETGEGVSAEALAGILNDLPSGPESCDLQFSLGAAMQLAVRDWAQRFAAEPIAGFLARVLVMNKKDLDSYQVNQQVLGQARNCLKVICKASKAIEEKLRQMFGKSRANLTALNAILK
jgi:hypothetical protein